jgi:hypothetical protein
MGKRAAWRLVDRDENTLPPLVYSTRKTQEDVVNEALEALDDHARAPPFSIEWDTTSHYSSYTMRNIVP